MKHLKEDIRAIVKRILFITLSLFSSRSVPKDASSLSVLLDYVYLQISPWVSRCMLAKYETQEIDYQDDLALLQIKFPEVFDTIAYMVKDDIEFVQSIVDFTQNTAKSASDMNSLRNEILNLKRSL